MLSFIHVTLIFRRTSSQLLCNRLDGGAECGLAVHDLPAAADAIYDRAVVAMKTPAYLWKGALG
jgi:hypothetical protein